MSFKEKRKFKTVERFAQHYKMIKDIGSGAFGSVKLGQHRLTETPCAIKIIRKQSLVNNIYVNLNKNEFEVLEATEHPNITRIFELLEDKRNYYIVMEIVAGGDLFSHINKMAQEDLRLTEGQVGNVIHQLLLALNCMHLQNIMHRDLKPENILIEKNADSDASNIYVKLTDFGFATRFDPNKKHDLSLGSPLYMAPELVQELEYDCKVDVWAIGVITFIALTGQPPFFDQCGTPSKESIYACIKNSEPAYKKLGSDSTPELNDFIQ